MPLFSRTKKFGYVRRKDAVRDFIACTHKPLFEQQAREIEGSGRGKQVLLWEPYEQVTGEPFVPIYQEIGDCVSHGFTLGAEVLSTVEIAVAGEREQWRGKFSTECTYAGSRVEIGGGRIRGDGSTGAWAARWVMDYGLLLRGVYGDFDLREYRPDLAKRWGAPGAGVPDQLEPILREHPIKTATLVQSYDEFIDAIANGYPVAICSNQGFRMQRDRDGFLPPSGKWAHCMLGWGFDDKSDRKGGCIANSWGVDWVKGPKHPLGCPDGCFWVDAKIIDRMLRQGDSYALSGFVGYPARSLDYLLLAA